MPGLWEKGHIRGLKARGGLEADIFWSNNKLDKIVIKSKFNNKFDLVYLDKVVPVNMLSGDTYIYEPQNDKTTKH